MERTMVEKRLHHDVEFAQRYSSQFEPTLNAHSAMWRLNALTADMVLLRGIPEIPSGVHNPKGFQGNRLR
jgi:hypothetical protein